MKRKPMPESAYSDSYSSVLEEMGYVKQPKKLARKSGKNPRKLKHGN